MTDENKPVSLIPCQNYERDEVQRAVFEAVHLIGGVESCIKKGSHVLVKPNLLMGSDPKNQVCTHPEVVASVCRLLTAHGCTVTVADSPGAGIPYNPKKLKRAYELAGYSGLASEPGVQLNYDTTSKRVSNPDGMLIKQFEIITPAVQADAIVVVSKLKTHLLTQMTGGTKNLFGLIPGLEKPTFHARFPDHEVFARTLVDLNVCMKPVLQIMDAVDIMEGNGPMAGKPAHLGVICASRNYAAIDVVAARLIGFDPCSIGTIRAAIERDILDESCKQVKVVGARVEDLSKTDTEKPETHSGGSHSPVKKLISSLLARTGRAYSLHPALLRDACARCGKCIRTCPTEAIAMHDGFPRFNLKSCISCFCCHEMCDSHAITIRSGWLRKIVRLVAK